MWINEAFAHYFTSLALWEFHGSKKSIVDDYCSEGAKSNCTCYRTIDENLDFFRVMGFESKMHSVYNQGPLYEKGRAWSNHLGYVYEWGAMFVRMLAGTIGKTNFQMAMQRYIKRNQYGAVDHERLWFELEHVNPFQKENVTLSTIFNSWIYKRGVPLLQVSRSNISGSTNILHLKQIHYSGPDGNSSALSPSVWYIPIRYILIHYNNGSYERTPNTSSVHQYLMRKTGDALKIKLQGNEDNEKPPVAIFNVNFTGTYHVGYDEAEWKQIGRVLMENPSLIPWFDRLQLVEFLKTSIRRKEVKPYLLLCIGEYIQVLKV